jgi:hypothetical protein
VNRIRINQSINEGSSIKKKNIKKIIQNFKQKLPEVVVVG